MFNIKDDAQVSEFGFECLEVPFNKRRATGGKSDLEEDYHFISEVEDKGEVT